ncbi:heparinase II/III family protein [Pseudoalteromonas peptidolytica]|uniref:heparinase II/III family protein n=1 Tax=Pseudoalteromonas peptidolytica TaxID=61150 RepID=UPI00298ECDD0|nr:heparinase II/III-family protein [Pseudoalteromonas peptidolytica]MDW7549438.1 heparinase II/III-family protein [Pseudoalteromonas peptidolytica]
MFNFLMSVINLFRYFSAISLFRFFLYKISIVFGFNSVKKITHVVFLEDFYLPYTNRREVLKCNTQWFNKHTYFGHEKADSALPNWHKSCLNGELAPAEKPWYLIGDFNNQLGDIKGVWEASRFDWVVSFAQHIAIGDVNALTRINSWLINWVESNPTYNGVNWKCGQEASIRVMHLALAALILKQTHHTTPALQSFIKAHLKRISPTIMYAIAQDNNHGTSEAAALYIGGSWLVQNGDAEGIKWQKQGLKWLENRAHNLIEEDGSFSQYSVTYHRVMIDTYSLVEVWRQKHKLPKFTKALYKKLSLASSWLYYFTNVKSGDAPNLGANDGARLIPLTSTDYRDFRPSVQLANVLFNDALAYEKEEEYCQPLLWLEIDRPAKLFPNKVSKDFPDGGYCYMKQGEIELYLNYPKFKFRPSQCDALHIDLWVDGKNVFRDGGTYSYNAGDKYISYYGGTVSHNTVQFDGHEQMPRLSRFLLGDWLKTVGKQTLKSDNNTHCFSVAYKDRYNCQHARSIELSEGRLLVTDNIKGFKEKAVLRYRLAPVDWILEDKILTSSICKLVFDSDVEFSKITLSNGKESRYYYQETDLPVLEIEVTRAGTITTEVIF